MKEMLCDKAHRGHAFVKVLGVMALAFLILVSIADAAPFAYITNSEDDTVSVIDTATNTITAAIHVGDNPVGVAATSDGSKVYVANQWSDAVSVIDTATNKVTATINVGYNPFGVAVSPDGTKVYITNTGDNKVSVINTATNTVTATIPLGQWPFGVAITPDGSKVYVANGYNIVSVIDTATNSVTATLDSGEPVEPFGVAVSPDGAKVYVTNRACHTVSVIETATNTVTAAINVGLGPHGVAVNPDGSKVYVVNNWDATVSVIDTATNTVTATVNVGSNPYGVSVNPDGTKVYVANKGSNTVSVIDTSTNAVTATVNAGNSPVAFGQFIGPLPASEPIDISEVHVTRITISGAASDPHIYGDRVVYEDMRNGHNIYMYNLSIQQETQISTSGTAYFPAIYGDRIVWKDDRNGKSDIYMYDIPTSQETQISTRGSAYSGSELSGPDIYNDRIVWQESYKSDFSTHCLVVYDLSTQQETQIAEEYLNFPYSGFYGFAIYGDKIVYNYFPCDDCDGNICMYDLSTQQTTGFFVTGTSPDVYGDRIVWKEMFLEGDPFGDHYYYHNIYMYDLSTQQKIQTSTGGKAHNPAIYNDKIVWEDGRNGQNIHVYDLSSSKETRITTSGSAYSPDIYGDRIVWVDGDDIYVGTLNYSISPVADFSTNLTSGYAPLTVLFTDLSENAVEWNWDFGNGATSTEQNPVHTYSAAGTYNVILTVSNSNGTDSKLTTITVSEQILSPVADFSASPIIGKAPLTVTFTDMSTGSPASWFWNFGDKSFSTSQDPVHTYNKVGKYIVSLTVTNAAGSDTKKVTKYIIVKNNLKNK